MIKLGVNTVLFGQRELTTALQHIRWAGYDAAEIAALGQMSNHLPLPEWRDSVSAIRSAMETAGLPLSAVEVGGIQKERVLPAIEACVELGIPVINVGPGGFKPGEPAELDRLADTLNPLCAEAEKAGVSICLKAHVNTAVHDTPTTLAIMERVPSPAFGIDMDPSHIHRGGENPAEALKQVVHRVKHVHIRDCKGPGPRPGAPEEQACGRGDIDLAGYCRVLVEAGYDGPVNLEVIGARDYELSRQAIIAAESYGYLNAILKIYGGR